MYRMVVMTSDSTSRRHENISCGDVSVPTVQMRGCTVGKQIKPYAVVVWQVGNGNGNGISATRTKECFIRACRHKSLIEVDVLDSGDLHAPNACLS